MLIDYTAVIPFPICFPLCMLLTVSIHYVQRHYIIVILGLRLPKLDNRSQFFDQNSHNFLLDSLIFVKSCIADRKNEIYRKKCYLNHGESKAVFGNNDTPIGRNDSTCRNVFSLCLNDSRHAALPIGFTRVRRQHACTCAREHTRFQPLPSSTQYNHTLHT